MNKLPYNKETLERIKKLKGFRPYTYYSSYLIDLYNDVVYLFNRIEGMTPETVIENESELRKEIDDISDRLKRAETVISAIAWFSEAPITREDYRKIRLQHHEYMISTAMPFEEVAAQISFILDDLKELLESKLEQFIPFKIVITIDYKPTRPGIQERHIEAILRSKVLNRTDDMEDAERKGKELLIAFTVSDHIPSPGYWGTEGEFFREEGKTEGAEWEVDKKEPKPDSITMNFSVIDHDYNITHSHRAIVSTYWWRKSLKDLKDELGF